MTTPVTETARFGGLPFATLAGQIRLAATARGLTVSDIADGLRVATPLGTLDFAAEGDRIRLTIAAPGADSLQLIREGAIETLARGLPDIARTLTWDSAPVAGALPPNFRASSVVSVRPLAQDFLRVRIAGERLEPFAGERMHFRLALPQPGDADPVWPCLDAMGRTIWPEGDKMLHRPAYTVIACDPAVGWLDFDVFEHDGGRTTEWARNARAGDRIGIVGPGSARIETATRMLLGGDETAYPALARTLAGLPADATGDLVLLSRTGKTDYPFDAPPGIRVTHLIRDVGPGLVETFRRLGPPEGGFLWAGAEHGDAMALREHFRAGLGWEKDRSYMAAFWNRG